jgi:hypothetical protein
MDNTTIIVLAGLVLVVLVAGWFISRGRRTKKLKEGFGPEYERMVQKTGDRSKAEKNLAERRKRVEEYELRSLTTEERTRFSREWDEVQRGFVDAPGDAVEKAQNLVDRVMKTRGYPIGDPRLQQEDVSVEAPEVVVHYRKARAIALRSGRNEATTEDLRLATQYYRELFRSLLESGEAVEPTIVETRKESEAHGG